MMTVEERIALRDELFIEFIKLKIIVFSSKYKGYIYTNKRIIKEKIAKESDIVIQYNKYVSEFKSENEALYCLRCQDDYTNHLCPICGNFAEFYSDGYNCNKYRVTCNQIKCRESLANSETANKKRIETNQNKYGKDNTFQVEEFKQKAEDTKERLYNDRYFTNRKKARNTNRERYGVDWYSQTEEFLEKAKESNQRERGCDWPAQDPIIVARQRETYFKNHTFENPIIAEECQFIFDQIKEGLQLVDVYSNNKYFEQFVQLSFINKNRLLQFGELAELFDCKNQTIGRRIHELELEEYFDIKVSKLELQFRDFLIDNGYVEKDDFTRYNHILKTQIDTLQEIDFLIPDHKLCFEINDIMNHNIKEKDSMYHYNKTLMAKDQYNLRLIHLWEWEVTDTVLWNKMQNWILHLLNQNKIQLDIFEDDNYDIRRIDKEELLIFLNNYSINLYQEFNDCIGIYYKDDLIEVLSFKGNILSIYVKFGYELIKGTKEIIQSYIIQKNLDYIFTYVDLSKFTGKTLENIGFKLIQYQEPAILSEFYTTSKRKRIYNCGYNIYMYSCF